MSESVNAWIDNEGQRKYFFAQVGEILELDGKARDQAIHLALGDVASVKDYGGTLEEALEALRQWKREALNAYAYAQPRAVLGTTARELPEAIGRISTKVMSAHGGVHLVTVSASGASPQEQRALLAELADYIELMDAGFPARGFAFIADGRDNLARPLDEVRGTAPAQATPRASRVRAQGGEEAVSAELEKAKARTAEVIRGTVVDTGDLYPDGISDQGVTVVATAQPGEISFPIVAIEPRMSRNGKTRFYTIKGPGEIKATCWANLLHKVFRAKDWPLNVDKPIESGMTCFCKPSDNPDYPPECVRIA